MSTAIRVTLYRWAGSWGPFSVRIACGECALTEDILRDTLDRELAGVPVQLEIRDWLPEWWRPLLRGGWHAPIVMVEGRVISQGTALNRGSFAQAVIGAHVSRNAVAGNHVYLKHGCPHCRRACGYLDAAGIRYATHDVVSEPRALYEMLGRVKPLVGTRTPIAVPQIWIGGHYIGGARALSELLDRTISPREDRGRSSLSPGDGISDGHYT